MAPAAARLQVLSAVTSGGGMFPTLFRFPAPTAQQIRQWLQNAAVASEATWMRSAL
jgi:hypothetical protein